VTGGAVSGIGAALSRCILNRIGSPDDDHEGGLGEQQSGQKHPHPELVDHEERDIADAGPGEEKGGDLDSEGDGPVLLVVVDMGPESRVGDEPGVEAR